MPAVQAQELKITYDQNIPADERRIKLQPPDYDPTVPEYQAKAQAAGLMEIAETVGIETADDTMTPLFESGTPIPTSYSLNMSTAHDNQSFIAITLLAGKSGKASECRTLAKATISEIPLEPAQAPNLHVEVVIDRRGIISLNAYRQNNK